MGKQSQNKFIKRKKELDRMQKAKDKMARRQGESQKKVASDESPIEESPAVEKPEEPLK